MRGTPIRRHFDVPWQYSSVRSDPSSDRQPLRKRRLLHAKQPRYRTGRGSKFLNRLARVVTDWMGTVANADRTLPHDSKSCNFPMARLWRFCGEADQRPECLRLLR